MPLDRPRLTPAIADVRRAVRHVLAAADVAPDSLLLVAVSGGPDSLALAAAAAFEAPRCGFRAGAIVIDHALQADSADIATWAADSARKLGLEPVLQTRVTVDAASGGPEGAARTARYAAFADAAARTGARHVLLGHTLDDQAETVLLGLARGAGATSLHGMAASTPMTEAPHPGVRGATYLRPLLGIRRAATHAFCVDSGLGPWTDPHNSDPAYARVRVRTAVLPTLERELGPGIAEALARTADQLREDGAALDRLAEEWAAEIVGLTPDGSVTLDVGGLASNPPALRQRILRFVTRSEYGVSLSRTHTLAIASLVTDWHGQGAVDTPGVRVERRNGSLVFTPAEQPLPLPPSKGRNP